MRRSRRDNRNRQSWWKSGARVKKPMCSGPQSQELASTPEIESQYGKGPQFFTLGLVLALADRVLLSQPDHPFQHVRIGLFQGGKGVPREKELFEDLAGALEAAFHPR